MHNVNGGIAAYWDEYADAYDAEPDHGLGDPATREAWRLLLERWLPARPSDVADLAGGTGSLTALAGWRSLLRPGGRFLLVEGRWWSVGDEDYDDDARMPWTGGVRAVDLAAALDPLVRRIEIVPLTDPVLWGKEIQDERYLLIGDV